MPNTLLKEHKKRNTQINRLTIDSSFYDFVNQSVLKPAKLPQESFWQSVEAIFNAFIPRNEALLQRRTELQNQIDAYHLNCGSIGSEDYHTFLKEIGYLVDPPAPFEISSKNVDQEIATMAGPQLVVPVMNARYALNAANARWGSLYDALYGTDVIDEENGAEKGAAYNPIRGQRVIDYARDFLNTHVAIDGCWTQVSGFKINGDELVVSLLNGEQASLKNPDQYLGYQGDSDAPTGIVFLHNQLHFIVEIDATHAIGKTDPAHIKDIKMESALTTIMDCEDSVAAVDAEDKTLVYKNWLGLMKGDLSETINKNGQSFERKMNQDIEFMNKLGLPQSLSGRALMFVRNVGHLMTNPVMQFDGKDIPEGILDGIITSAIGKIDVDKSLVAKSDDPTSAHAQIKNSEQGSIYIVKPKMHGPEEVAFTNDLFNAIEDAIGLTRFTIKMGIMDEERRTSVNLRACINQAKERVVFINTGFLDRTGDEIHTSMLAGPFQPKAILKTMPWINAYEESNVASGLTSGFNGKAQIGKGMWPVPDNMAEMMTTKIGHAQSGANTAWVPSPTAATLHVLHYHQVTVASIQQRMLDEISSQNLLTLEQQRLSTILQIPLLNKDDPLTPGKINHELDNNAQGILGYVVRWVDAGIGCSKVPDINNVGLMEDRATCRISSQHMTNWLTHGLCSEERIIVVMKKMAAIVDQQNQDVDGYEPMGPDFDSSIAFNAALDLVIKGKDQPSGYTEPLLHKARLAKKRSLSH